jgi:hypothetical protein
MRAFMPRQAQKAPKVHAIICKPLDPVRDHGINAQVAARRGVVHQRSTGQQRITPVSPGHHLHEPDAVGP